MPKHRKMPDQNNSFHPVIFFRIFSVSINNFYLHRQKLRVLKALISFLVIIVVFFKVLCLDLIASTPSDTIDLKQPDLRYLELLISQEIDEFRSKNGLDAFLRDSLLCIASDAHLSYLTENKELTHFQSGKRQTETPSKRVLSCGLTSEFSAENIALIQIGTSSYYKYLGESSEHTVNTYKEAAEDVVVNFTTNPESYGNLMSRGFVLSGLRAMQEPNSNVIRVVQTLSAFPNGYIMNPCLSCYDKLPDDISDRILSYRETKQFPHHHKHAFGIKSLADRNSAQNVKKKFRTQKRVYTSVSGKNVSLYVSDFKNLRYILGSPGDALAVEIIPFDVYKCNSPDYYSVSSRRNGRCIFNGKVEQPVTMKELYPEDEQGKTDRADNTIDYSKLDRNPGKNETINTLLIKDGELVEIVPQQAVCGDIIRCREDTLPILFGMEDIKYIPRIMRDTLKLMLYFERGKVEGKYEDLKPYLDFLKRRNYYIAEAQIEAFASIEGDKETNEKLFNERAELFVKLFRSKQNSDIDIDITTEENWDLFFKQIKGTEFEKLTLLDTLAIRSFVNDPVNMEKLDDLLDKQRYANVNLIAVPYLKGQQLIDFAKKEAFWLIDTIPVLLKNKTANHKAIKSYVDQLASIQQFFFRLYLEGKTSLGFIQQISSFDDPAYSTLKFNYVAFKYKYLLTDWMPSEFFDEIIEFKGNAEISPFYWYNLIATIANDPNNEYYYSEVPMKEIKKMVDRLGKSKINSELVRKINLFYHLKNCSLLYEEGSFSKAKTSLRYLQSYYESYGNENDMLVFAGHLVEFQQEKTAIEVLEKLVAEPDPNREALSFLMKLKYAENTQVYPSDYYYQLFDSMEILSEDWCDLFGNECSISYNIFDYEPLWKAWCKKCSENLTKK